MVGGLKGRLVINKRWHWRLYIDVSIPPRLEARKMYNMMEGSHEDR